MAVATDTIATDTYCHQYLLPPVATAIDATDENEDAGVVKPPTQEWVEVAEGVEVEEGVEERGRRRGWKEKSKKGGGRRKSGEVGGKDGAEGGWKGKEKRAG